MPINGSNSGFLGNLPILDGKNWDRQHTQMKVLFGFQDVLELVTIEFNKLGENPTDAERVAQRNQEEGL